MVDQLSSLHRKKVQIQDNETGMSPVQTHVQTAKVVKEELSDFKTALEETSESDDRCNDSPVYLNSTIENLTSSFTNIVHIHDDKSEVCPSQACEQKNKMPKIENTERRADLDETFFKSEADNLQDTIVDLQKQKHALETENKSLREQLEAAKIIFERFSSDMLLFLTHVKTAFDRNEPLKEIFQNVGQQLPVTFDKLVESVDCNHKEKSINLANTFHITAKHVTCNVMQKTNGNGVEATCSNEAQDDNEHMEVEENI